MYILGGKCLIFLERKLVILGAFFLLALVFCGAASAATVIVNPGTDTIKNAVSTAQDGDTLSLTAGTYYDHEVVVNKNLVITGPEYTTGDPLAVIDAQQKGRVFNITTGRVVTLRNLLITNGTADSGEYGGGVHNSGQATIQRCKFTRNQALWGGAIYNNFFSTITATDCVFHLNSATDFGGAIKNEGPMTMTGCVLTSNTAPEGGALNNGDFLEVTGCTFTSNTGTIGGVLNNYGTVVFTSCTFTGNSATRNGGVVDNYGTTIFTDCTLTGNSATEHGAVFHNNLNEIMFNGCTITGNSAPWGGVLSCFKGTVNAQYNRIYSNNGNSIVAVNGGTVNIQKNWWGSNAPNFSSMISVVPGATANYSPWIVLKITKSAETVAPGATATITADLNSLNTGAPLTDGYLPNLPVAFTGTVNPLTGTTQYGTLATTFTAGSVGTSTVTATVDGQTVSTTITISGTPLPNLDVSSIDPVNNAVNVATNRALTVTYNRDIQAGSMWIELKDASGNSQAFTTNINGKVLTVTPTGLLKEGVKYTLTIHPGAVKDTSGGEGPLTTTSFNTAGSAPTVTGTPGTGSYWAPVSVVLAASETSTIYYTTDGSNPTVASAKYTSPLYLATSRTLRFLGVDTAGNPSQISTQFYTIYALQYYKYWAKVRVYGWYKYSYKVRYKRWYRRNGRWRYYYKYRVKTKWKKGWHYVGAWKTASRWVLT